MGLISSLPDVTSYQGMFFYQPQQLDTVVVFLGNTEIMIFDIFTSLYSLYELHLNVLSSANCLHYVTCLLYHRA